MADRIREQTVAEIANKEEQVRYITNAAGISRHYRLLIRVQNITKMEQTKKRWSSLLDQFHLPSFVTVEVEFLSSNQVAKVLAPPSRNTDWIFVVQESTYVHVSRLVHRLFADLDPISMDIRMGLLTSVHNKMIPQLEAGILLSQKTLEEMWNRSQSCQGMKALEGWFLCLANEASLDWTGLPGLNSYNVRDMMRWSLEGSLFFNNNTYESVGGPIQGTARLPITYGQMLDDHLFYQQLAVDTHQGEVPKILHQIWSGPLDNMPSEVRDAAKGCQRMHEEQGWEYVLWDDKKLQSLPGIPKLVEMTKDIKLVRHYTDAIRLYLLHQFGGVYLDADSFCVRPLDPLLQYMKEERVDFLANYESERLRGQQIANGIMIAAPASPVLTATTLHLGIKLFNMPLWKNRSAWKMTGPWCLTETRDQWTSWVQPHQIILSSAAFIPLYKDEGKGFSPSDMFALAARQGSYTIQMYQSTKNVHLYSLIRENERCESLTQNNKTKTQETELMIVAHPDDEFLWGGEYLLKTNHSVHVVVTSTQNKNAKTRRAEFMAAEKRLGYHGELLDGSDSNKSMKLEGHIKRRIHDLICGQEWEKIITHGPEGEYGHPKHQQVHDAVIDAVKFCCRLDKLHVFEPRPTDGYSFSKEKEQVGRVYESQWKVLKKFEHWKERIVSFAEYDFQHASKDCREEAARSGSTSTRKCRLHKTMNFT
jgi:mannosyltransferase OCH1-like enzyme/LmbE family N-acetylglucosaminyl deacetylase